MPLHDKQLFQLLHAIEEVSNGITVTSTTNLTQIAGNAVNTGTGAAGTGTLRVTTSTDSTIGTLTSGNVGGFTTIASTNVIMSVAGAYANGDYMGQTTTPQSFASAVRTSGGTGIIKSVFISDKITTANVPMELWILDRTFTAPTDNAAWAISDTEATYVQAIIPLSTSNWYTTSNNQVYSDYNVSYPFKISTGTALFFALVSRGVTPAFTSLDLTVSLGIIQD